MAGLAIIAYNCINVAMDAKVGIKIHLTETRIIEIWYTETAKPADSHPQLLTAETDNKPSQQPQIGMGGKP